MDERDPLRAIAEKYRMEGYEVAIHPDASDLPAFLANTPIDILARRHDHLVAIKSNDRPQGDNEHVEVSADLGADSAALLVEEAELLLSPRTIRAALAMAWAAFEAAARAVLKPKNGPIAGYGPNKLIDEIRSMGFVSDDEFLKLQESLYLRNAIVHGARPDDFSPQLVPFLLGTARRLLNIKPTIPAIRFSDSASAVIVRRGINQSSFKELVDRATELLFSLLGAARSNISIDWELAEDARNRPVIILKLSDAYGTASATFEPAELGDQNRLAARLDRLWGDLLELRSQKLVKRLTQTAGAPHLRGPAE